MTESTAVGTRGFNTEHSRKYSSIGLLAPNTEAKVVDWVTGCFLPPGSSGELWIRGPAVMKGDILCISHPQTTLIRSKLIKKSRNLTALLSFESNTRIFMFPLEIFFTAPQPSNLPFSLILG